MPKVRPREKYPRKLLAATPELPEMRAAGAA